MIRVSPWLAVVDYGAGNLRSLGAALDAVGAGWRLASEPRGLEGAAAIVLPGVGAARPAMRALAARSLDRALAEAPVPIFGICLGMQLLCERLSEGGIVEGLGLVPGLVEPLPETLKRPHMGWNHVARARAARVAIPDGWYYFAHSYAARCESRHVLAWTEYGGARIAAAIGGERAWGVQFHPEKSAEAGLALLGAFWSAIRSRASAVPR